MSPNDHDAIARHFETGRWVRVTLDGPAIAAVAAVDGPAEVGEEDAWIAPAFWDIQTNGRWGVSYSDPSLTVDRAAEIIRAQAGLGTARLCPTLITATRQGMEHGVRTLAAACERFADVAAMVLGLHLEGPYISPLDGYRGAHPLAAVRDPCWEEFEQLQAAAGGRIVLLTLAPERPGAIGFIEKATRAGVVVALGHTAADGPTIRAAVAAGARLSTHLGNGIAATLPRHPNPIWDQAAEDRLWASFIADGHHLDGATLRTLSRAKWPRVLLVSDASPLAGLPPGRYDEWAVDPSGKIVVAETPYLAGSNQGLDVGLATWMQATGMGLADALATVTTQPALLLGHAPPELAAGRVANLVRFRRPRPGAERRLRLSATCVDGAWAPALASPVAP